jgi:proteasome lid subunit RPN8/RPN11
VFRRLIRLPFGRRARLRFKPAVWQQMFVELHRRGEERREAGAFLLAERKGDSRLISRIVYLDDLDPKCLVGGIHFHGEAYSKLWDICEEEGLRVLADIHTHPSPWVEQSSTDRENPMVSRRGHIGLIAPDYGAGKIDAKQIGFHEYRGEEGWVSCFKDDACRFLYIGRFA